MTKLRTIGLIGAALALLGAACGNDDGASSTVEASDAGASEAGAGGAFPVTVANCGAEYTFTEAPTAAITMNQHVTEILLALGLEDSMVGTAWLDSTIRPDLAEAYERIEVLADQYPSRERVLAAEPDIVVGGYASAFGDEAAGSRESLLDAGINTYLTSGYCPDFTGANSLDLMTEDIRNLGAIFGVPERAEQLVADIAEPIEQAQAGEGERPGVFVYDSGTDLAFTAGGLEMTTALIDEAGGRNIFDDVDDAFTEVSWEDVVDRDPDVVMILNYGDTTADDKQSFLDSDPTASTLRAVQEGNVFVVELTDVVPGIRNGDVVATMAQELHGG